MYKHGGTSLHGHSKKREWEKQVVAVMIAIYCHGKHKSKRGIVCEECQKLTEYAWSRSDRCPNMEKKTFCSKCKTHCYKPEMREKIRAVMRYSGPRMLWHYPAAAIRHFLLEKK